MDPVRQELLTHIEHLRADAVRSADELRRLVKDGFSGVHSRLDTLNGRVGGLEQGESAHHERIGALERTVESTFDAQKPSRRQQTVTFSVGAGAGAVIVKLLEMAGKAIGQ